MPYSRRPVVTHTNKTTALPIRSGWILGHQDISLICSTDHYAGGDGDASTAVSVGHNVTVADAQEGYGNQPHGVEQIGMLLVVVPALHLPIFYFSSFRQHRTCVVT